MKKFFFYFFGLLVLCENAFSAVAFDALNGFSGFMDLKYFLSSVVIIVFAIGVITSIKLGLFFFKAPFTGSGCTSGKR